ncbi:hypothetical protein ACWEQP_16520 [Streptomyces sp. NPDC004044]
MSEAFNSVLKVEYVHRHTFATRAGLRRITRTPSTGYCSLKHRSKG